jgi:hypothetical protein
MTDITAERNIKKMDNEEYEVSFEEWWEFLDDIERENYNMIMKEYEENDNEQ